MRSRPLSAYLIAKQAERTPVFGALIVCGWNWTQRHLKQLELKGGWQLNAAHTWQLGLIFRAWQDICLFPEFRLTPSLFQPHTKTWHIQCEGLSEIHGHVAQTLPSSSGADILYHNKMHLLEPFNLVLWLSYNIRVNFSSRNRCYWIEKYESCFTSVVCFYLSPFIR